MKTITIILIALAVIVAAMAIVVVAFVLACLLIKYALIPIIDLIHPFK